MIMATPNTVAKLRFLGVSSPQEMSVQWLWVQPYG